MNASLTIGHTLFHGNVNALGALDSCGISTGNIVSQGNDLIDAVDPQCGLDRQSPSNDIVAQNDANLGPVSDNGGFVPTMALLQNSIAVDAGDNAKCADTDARGYPRPANGDNSSVSMCDIGAFERQQH